MATPVNDSYNCLPGGHVAAGRYNLPAWLRARTAGVNQEIPGTSLASSPALFQWPNGLKPGDQSGCVNAWGGWVRVGRYIYLTGGGHSDYNGNEIYRMDVFADVLVWELVSNPTPLEQVVAYLNNTVGDCSHWNEDGKPTAAHVYWSMLAIGNKIIRPHYFNYHGKTLPGYLPFAPNNEAWLPMFDVGNLAWDAPNAHALMPNWGMDAKGDGSIAYAPCWTDGTFLYAHLLNKALGRYCLNKLDPVANIWTGGPDIGPFIIPKTPGGQDVYPAPVYDSKRHEGLVICEGSEQSVRRYNFTTGLVTVTPLTGLPLGLNWSSSYSGRGYDPLLDVIYIYSGKADTDKFIYIIDPNDNYRVSIMAGTGTAVPDTTPGGMNSRFMLIPELRCLLGQPSFASNLICTRL